MIVLIFLICFGASTAGGVCGIGGGVVIKPLLDVLGVMPVSTASFLSGLTVLAMACVNVFKNRRGGELDAERSVPLGVGAAAGGVAGKMLFSTLKAALNADRAVGAVQAAALGLMVLGTMLYMLCKNRVRTRSVGGWAVPALIGLGLGVCSSFLGIGGGPMNLAVLSYFFSMDTKKATVNSILIILISQLAALGMSLVSRSVPPFRWEDLGAMACAGILGGALSARLHKRFSARTTDRLFISLMAVILGICVYNVLRVLA